MTPLSADCTVRVSLDWSAIKAVLDEVSSLPFGREVLAAKWRDLPGVLDDHGDYIVFDTHQRMAFPTSEVVVRLKPSDVLLEHLVAARASEGDEVEVHAVSAHGGSPAGSSSSHLDDTTAGDAAMSPDLGLPNS